MVTLVINPFRAGVGIRRQRLTSEVDPRTERIKKIIMTVDPQHRYSNEAKKDNYDDFKLINHLVYPWFIQKYFRVVTVKLISAEAVNTRH